MGKHIPIKNSISMPSFKKFHPIFTHYIDRQIFVKNSLNLSLFECFIFTIFNFTQTHILIKKFVFKSFILIFSHENFAQINIFSPCEKQNATNIKIFDLISFYYANVKSLLISPHPPFFHRANIKHIHFSLHKYILFFSKYLIYLSSEKIKNAESVHLKMPDAQYCLYRKDCRPICHSEVAMPRFILRYYVQRVVLLLPLEPPPRLSF